MRTMLLILLLPIMAMATQTEITSLPFTFDADDMSLEDTDTITIQGTKLSATGSGISLESVYGTDLTDVVLLLGTDTVEFGTDGGAGVYGVRLYGTGSNWPTGVIIEGGHILHAPADSTASGCYGILGRANNCLLDTVHVRIAGLNGIAVDWSGTMSHNNRMYGGIYESVVTGFDSRCDGDAPVIKCDHSVRASLADSTEFHLEMDSVTISGGPHVGFWGYAEAGDTMRVWIHKCNITTDARNDMYLEYSGLCYSAANPYAIFISSALAGTVIDSNTVRSGTSFGGNRGIYVGYGYGTASNPIRIFGNDVDVHEGPNVEEPDNFVHGLRIRYQPRYFSVYDNIFKCTGDSAAATTDYGPNVHPVRLSTNSSATNVDIYNNTIEAATLGDGDGVTCYGVTFDGVDYADSYYLYNNNITSAGMIYKYGEVGTQSNGPTGISIIGDTVGFASTKSDSITFYLGHLSNNWLCYDNTARDIVYQDGTSDTNIVFSAAGTLDITIQRTLNIYAIGNDDQPVGNAACSVWNDYGQQVLTGTTSESGLVSGVVSYWYESRTDTDSTAFNDFIIHVRYGEDVATDSSFTVGSSVAGGLDSLVLSATSGGGGKFHQTVKILGGKIIGGKL